MSYTSDPYAFFYPATAGEDYPAAEHTAMVQALGDFLTQVAELLGLSGCFAATDFNLTAIPAELAVQISAGRAFVGDAGDRKLVYKSAVSTVEDGEDGVTITPSTTNYFYLQQDGTWTANTTGTIPTGAIKVGSAVFDTDDATSVDSNPAGRVNLGVAILSGGVNAMAANLPAGGFRITGLADPASAQDAATKAYVDATASGLQVKDSVRVATTANITLSGAQTIDGVSVIAGDRVLVKDQSTGAQNGIYVCASGAWSRAADADAAAEVEAGLFVFVQEGTANGDSGWVLTTNNAITIGSTSLAFAQFSGAGQITAGAGMTKTGNTLDVQVDNSTVEISSDTVRLKDAGTTVAKLANDAQDAIGGAPTLSAAAEVANARQVTIQCKDAAGNNLAERRLVRVWIGDSDFGGECAAAPDGGVSVNTGALLQTVTAGKQLVVLSNTSGVVAVTLTESTTKTFYVMAGVASKVGSVAVAFA